MPRISARPLPFLQVILKTNTFTGKDLNLGVDFDSFSDKSHTDYYEVNDIILLNDKEYCIIKMYKEYIVVLSNFEPVEIFIVLLRV